MLKSAVLLAMCLVGYTCRGIVAKDCNCECDCSPEIKINQGCGCEKPQPKPTVGGVGSISHPAYLNDNDKCPDQSNGRVLKLVNNCRFDRWFKLDGRTTPEWVTRPYCPWANIDCVLTPVTDPQGILDCRTKISTQLGLSAADTDVVYCKSSKCSCNPYFFLSPGNATEIHIPDSEQWPSATGWLANPCNQYGADCVIGNSGHLNSLFEFTYDQPLGSGNVWYDISAVNSWTYVSPVGMKVCNGSSDIEKSSDPFWCGGAGCNYNVNSQCPGGSGSFTPGPGPDGNSANIIPTGTVFNQGTPGQWTWNGSPNALQGWGTAEGLQANRRYTCTKEVCIPTPAGNVANTCIGGCDLCTVNGDPTTGDNCVKYCCPDITKSISGNDYRFDSEGCLALGVQNGTNYSPNLKDVCNFVYTYGYEDHTSTFQCYNTVSLMVMACPKVSDFPQTRQ